MIDLDRDSLDRVLPAEPELAGWDDVLTRSRVHTGRRHRRLVVLATVMLMAVATASAFGVRALMLGEGFVGVPPDGATPSTPERGELVLTYMGHPAATEGRLFKAFLYADGRLIWDQERPLEDGKSRTGFLEQRLTPEGVELLLSEFISTGLFDRDVELGARHSPNWAGISVRNGSRFVGVDFGTANAPGDDVPTQEPTPAQERAIARLGALLVDPGSWLPASAWENREIRAYVGSRYEVCVAVDPPFRYPTEPIEPYDMLELSEILTLIPPAPANLLREAEWTEDETTLADGRPYNSYCADVTTQKAQAIAKALEAAGLERDQPSVVQVYSFIPPSLRKEGRAVGISLQTYLPHGETICEACG